MVCIHVFMVFKYYLNLSKLERDLTNFLFQEQGLLL